MTRPPKARSTPRPQGGDPLAVLPPLTAKQARCLQYLFAYFQRHRYFPTQREIAAEMGMKSPAATAFTEPLIKKGYLRREPGVRRNLRLTPRALEKLERLRAASNAEEVGETAPPPGPARKRRPRGGAPPARPRGVQHTDTDDEKG